ncbi:hypothetical protein J0A78_18390 [Providencia rettgeri]|nr:hypothetical protein [Providencia rettgeri]MBN7843615.1 hypothetical protein [Providencia rettgeri]MBN7855847.1 hypothetical protein [Providencia rettgeri]MBN7863871.1 hypothetical protein [Providencia rettgeri]MBN7873346.1 hypothetical protein [Providencia rettgeri]MBN7923706.1 hypothetical protein [Providencia rettgeri]
MKKLHNCLVVLSLFKERLERDLYLIETSIQATRKYAKKLKEINQFNEDLKQSMFLKQIIDICAFLEELNIFRGLGGEIIKVQEVSKRIKPGIDRINKVKGLKRYRNALVAHNFRVDSNKYDIVLLSDYTRDIDNPNSIAEMFFLSSICLTIIEVIFDEFKNEYETAMNEYRSKLIDDRNDPLRGIENIREAYDKIDHIRLELALQPIFLGGEFEEFKMALEKIDWAKIPDGFQLSNDNTNSNWCEVLDKYLRMRGYNDITIFQGKNGHYTGVWLELYGFAITVIEKVYVWKPTQIRENYREINLWVPSQKIEHINNINVAYKEIMKVVAP